MTSKNDIEIFKRYNLIKVCTLIVCQKFVNYFQLVKFILHPTQPHLTPFVLAAKRGGYLEDGCFFFCDSITIFRGIKMSFHGISTSPVTQASSCTGCMSIGFSSTRSLHGISNVESQLSGLACFDGRVSIIIKSFHGRSIVPRDSFSSSSLSTPVSSICPSRSFKGVKETSWRIFMPAAGNAISFHGSSIFESHSIDTSENSFRNSLKYGSCHSSSSGLYTNVCLFLLHWSFLRCCLYNFCWTHLHPDSFLLLSVIIRQILWNTRFHVQ